MAAKKNSTQAQKAVSDAKKKASGGKSGSTAKKKTADTTKKAPVVKTEYDQALPANGVIAATSLGLFVLLLFTAVNPDGAVLKLILSFMLGLLGPVGFYFLIPGLLYIFAIHTFGRKSHVRMRMFCKIIFRNSKYAIMLPVQHIIAPLHPAININIKPHNPIAR